MLASERDVVHNVAVFNKTERDQILNKVVEALRQSLSATFGRDVEVVVGKPQVDGADAVLVLATEAPPIRFHVQVKTSITPATVAALGARSATTGLILFAPRLTTAGMEACRQFGVGCADADGNVYIRSGTSAVDIQGRPATASRPLTTAAVKGTRLTSRSGLQILFVLLSMPEVRDVSFREIAAASDTSLGSVAAVFQELERRGYLNAGASGRSLHRTRELLDTWVDGYRLRLFARLRLGTFATDVTDWWRTSGEVVRAAGGQWGSETALWARGDNLRPARGVVYVDEVPSALVAGLRLRRDDQMMATAELRRRFWHVPVLSRDATVPTPLVYADLLADGDPRLVEAAANLRRTDADLRRLDQS